MKYLLLILPLIFAAPVAEAWIVIPSKVLKAETKVFYKIDTGGNALISFDEFRTVLKPYIVAFNKFPITGKGDNPAELLEICEELFDLFDVNVDGSIDVEEWVVFRYQPRLADVARLVTLLPGFDRNHDGTVRPKEYASLLKFYFPLKQVRAVHRQITAAT
ncbi:hypothetical protein [Luteolibacter sp. Populi]|uniref:hypothetical protein n=1 Tax=Luteolibacter sp. Populi TaxID=3230487 RepID=UPI003467992D